MKTKYIENLSLMRGKERIYREKIMDGILGADKDDWIIVSDLDEIPNLEEINFNTKKIN